MDLLGQMTQRGKELRQLALAGGTVLQYVRAAAGSGDTPLSANVLAEEQQVLALGDLSYTENSVILPVTLVAAQAESAYTLTEVGVYVQDGQGESLYCIYKADTGLPVAPASAMSMRIELEDISAESPGFSVSPAGLVTQTDLADLMGAPGGIASLDGSAAVPMEQLPFTFGTEDLVAGESPLKSGSLHFVYE